MFRKTLVVRALATAFGIPVLLFATSPTAYAQTNATGTVSGQVETPAGATIIVESLDTGARRTVTPGADGKYAAANLPVGRYKVTLQRGGATVTSRDNIVVVIGGSTDASFTSATLQAVSVVGRRQTIDVSAVGSTTTFTSAELSRLPITPSVASIIQLAPGTTRGDSRYGGGNAPSFGGASASENATYINGFPVTTLLTQVGFAQLPFNAIAQAQILTGGYTVEFGRSTGGVTNIVTKSGSNDIVFGVGAYLEPSGLRAREKNQYYGVNGNAPVDGKLYLYNQSNKQEITDENFYFGGPLIKDKLFIFFAAENQDTNHSFIRTTNSGTQTFANSAAAATNCGTGAGTFANASRCDSYQVASINEPKVLLKLDWNITDSNHLEYSKIYDEVTDNRTYYGFNYNTLQRNNIASGGAQYTNWGPTPVAAAQGASIDILKYTGYLTNDFTLQAVLGETRTPHKNAPATYNPALPVILPTTPFPGLSVPTPQSQTTPLLVPGASDRNRGLRLDLDWRISSQHNVRAGVDYNKIDSIAGTATPGGYSWTYNKGDPTKAIDLGTPTLLNSQAGNPIALAGYYATRGVVTTNTTPSVVQAAEYIQDRWQITDRFLLTLGLRNESFDNRNENGESYIKISKQLAPRVGAAWDVLGDSSFKLYGNAGRYHVPIPTNVAVRAAGPSLNTTQQFAYTGVDQATGAPTGTVPLGAPYSVNNEYGQQKDPKTVAGQDLKGMYQDELSLGFDKAISKSFVVGAKFTYRTLRTVIDDFCDTRPFLAYAARNNINTANYGGFNCALFNPGEANRFLVDYDGTGKNLTSVYLSKEDLGFPKVSRKYMALDLTAEYPFDGKYWAKLVYTLSRNNGNTEGQLLSDIGQADVATTQAFDFPEFSLNSNGLLPNDRKHQFKAFGYYQVLPEWGVGGNLLAASGRPRNCIGNPPVGVGGPGVYNYAGYTSAYFFCNGVATPRGSQGRLPSDIRFDMDLSYRPLALPGLMLKIDVFNVFNRQAAETVSERYNQTPSEGSPIANAYGTVLSYNTPRTIRLGATYDYKF